MHVYIFVIEKDDLKFITFTQIKNYNRIQVLLASWFVAGIKHKKISHVWNNKSEENINIYY